MTIDIRTHFDFNTQGRDFFIGDLHGAYDLFQDKLRRRKFDSAKDRMFSVGDLIDRGPKSLECLHLLREPWFHAVRGNHEEMMLGKWGHSTWMMNGGAWADHISVEQYKDGIDLIQNTMPYFMTVDTEQGRIGVVHAESADDWDLNIPTERTTWGRTRIMYGDTSVVEGIDLVVVGHTILDVPHRLGNVVYIDTGAYHNDTLTMVTAKQLTKIR